MRMRFFAATALLISSSLTFAQQLPDAPGAESTPDKTPEMLASAKPVGAANAETAGTSTSRALLITPAIAPSVEDCTVQGPHTSACNFHWRKAISESFEFLAMEHWMNMPTYKGELRGRFFHEWFRAVDNHRWADWDDGDEFLVNYIGHPMSGATTGYIQIQNDPRGASLELSASKAYVHSRLKAMAWTAVYSAQWEIGPMSEASFGHLGNFHYVSHTGLYTNGTGWCDFVNTPVLGTALVVGEDAMDKYVIKRIEGHSQNRALMLGVSILTPTRSLSNLLRFKAPWYRESRQVGSWSGVY